MPAFEWVHVQLHQQKGMISLSPPTICNSATRRHTGCMRVIFSHGFRIPTWI
ncbi:putative transposase [Escherichia coli 2865200]|nr:putative transposase [Escherichia coli 2865200]